MPERRRCLGVLGVLVVVYLAVSMQPVAAASSSLVVVSQHSTDTDFNDANTLSNVTVEDSGVRFQSKSGASRPTDNSVLESLTDPRGLIVVPRDDLTGVSITISSLTDGATTAYVTTPAGTVLDSAAISGGTADLVAELRQGQKYYVVVDAEGSEYDIGAYDSATYPYTGSSLNITGGVFSGTRETAGDAYTITAVEPLTAGATGQYVSPNHTVTDAQQAAVNLSLSNTTAAISVEEPTGSGGWQTVASTTVTSSGNHTLDVSSATTQTLQVNVTFSNQTGNGLAEGVLHDESILATNHAPQVDNASATPRGNVSSAELTLRIDASDSEFGTSQGDEVTAEFFVGGESVGVATITSNGTVSTTTAISSSTSWHVEVTDSYELTTQSQSFDLTAPSTISILNETSSLLVDNMTVNLQLYTGESGGNAVIERNTSDGVANLSGTGLAADEPFVAVADATNYTSRRVFVPSLFEADGVYLLPASTPSATKRFRLEDYSGSYDTEDSVLLIQRFINGSWRTVEGDYFGATGSFSAHLRLNTRHRLIIRNQETGAEKRLGSYTPVGDGEEVIEVNADGDISIVDSAAAINLQPSVRQLPDREAVNISATIRKQNTPLRDYNMSIIAADDGVNTTIAYAAGSASSGETLTRVVNLSGFAGSEVYVVTEYTTEDGRSGSETERYSVFRSYTNDYSLLDGLASVEQAVPARHAGTFTSVLGVILTLIGTSAAAAKYRLSTEMVGGIAVAHIAAFALIGWISFNILFVTGATWVTVAAFRRGL